MSSNKNWMKRIKRMARWSSPFIVPAPSKPAVVPILVAQPVPKTQFPTVIKSARPSVVQATKQFTLLAPIAHEASAHPVGEEVIVEAEVRAEIEAARRAGRGAMTVEKLELALLGRLR